MKSLGLSPAILVVIPLEGAPFVRCSASDDAETRRLYDWLSRPGSEAVGQALRDLLRAIDEAAEAERD